MNDTEFHTRATTILDAIEAQADHWFEKLDLDVETKRNGNVLNLIFENGHQVVINSQAPLHEMWLAARSGGFHYRFMAATGKIRAAARTCMTPCLRFVPKRPVRP